MSFQQRNSTLEILRFFFMLCVVVGHVYGHGSGLDAEFMNGLGDSWKTMHHYLSLTIAKIGVVGFMLISGYMGMKLNVRKIIILFGTMLFYTYATYIYQTGSLNILHALKYTTNYWFVCSYIVVAIIATLFEPALETLSKKTWNIVIASLAVYYGLYHLYIGSNDRTTDFLLFIYLCGRYLRSTPPILKIHLRHQKVYVISIICLVIYVVGAVVIPNSYMRQWRSNDNLLFIGMCYGWIVWCVNHPTYNKFINFWSGSILGIYLITESRVLRPHNSEVLAVMMDNYALGLLLIIGICIVCLLVDKVRFYLFEGVEFLLCKLKQIVIKYVQTNPIY